MTDKITDNDRKKEKWEEREVTGYRKIEGTKGDKKKPEIQKKISRQKEQQTQKRTTDIKEGQTERKIIKKTAAFKTDGNGIWKNRGKNQKQIDRDRMNNRHRLTENDTEINEQTARKKDRVII